MRVVSQVTLVLRSIFRRRRVEEDLADELRFHVEREMDAQAARGMSPEDARLAARRTLGSVEQIKDACRDARGPAARLDALQRDVRHTVRLMRKSPGFTLVAVLSLALGIGANSAVFSLLDAAVLHPVAYADADRITTVQLVLRSPEREGSPGWSFPKFDEVNRLLTAFESVAGFAGTDVNLSGASDPVRLRGELVSAAYARTLGIAPILGRDFRADEDRAPRGELVVLLSEDLWRRQFGGDPGILDRLVMLNGLSFRVIGILPSGYRGETGRAELWVPLTTAPQVTGRGYALVERGAYWIRAIGRLRPDVTATQAEADLQLAVSRIHEGTPPNPRGPAVTFSGRVTSLADSKVDPLVRRSLLVLLSAVGLVLLIACLNLGSLLLARAMARQREIAVRLALGASRGALVRQFLIESLLIAALGGAVGLLMARGLLDVVRLVQPALSWDGPPFLRGLDFGLAQVNGYVVTFTALVSLATVVVFGVGPAWHASRGDVRDGLKTGAISIAARGRDRRGFRARGALVVVQLALTLVLLIGAGLMMRSLAGLVQTSAGIDPSGMVTFRLDQPNRGAPDVTRATFEAVIARLSALPGVEAAAVTATMPLTRTRESTGGKIDGTIEWPEVGVHAVGPEFFRMMRIPLRRGRLFTAADREGAPRVALVNESAARRFWPDGNPIGSRVSLGLNGWGGKGAELPVIVGVVGDVKYDRLEDPPRLALYVTASQRVLSSMYVVVRTHVDPLTLVAPIRQEVAAVDSTLPIYDIRTMTDRVADASSRTRFQGVLLTIFAILALTIATIGVSGVMAYAVTMRTRELGVRLALGADRVDISRLIVGQAALLAACALVVGLPLAFITTRILRGLLFNVTPGDPITFASAASVLAVVALAACWRPARRAGRIDPLVALRHE